MLKLICGAVLPTLVALPFFTSFTSVAAAEPRTSAGPILYETVVRARAVKQGGSVATGTIGRKRLDTKSSRNLIEALDSESGVDIQTTCANCGAKRVMLNGMRGEHTTVLVDGFPLHSSIASLYGLDAMPIAGVERIEISRGTGAAQLAPEAIGGVVNVVTQKPRGNDFSTIAELGNAGSRLVSTVGTWVSANEQTRAAAAFQLSENGFWDVDGNGVSEFPTTRQWAGYLKASREWGDSWLAEAKYARQSLGALGGNTSKFRPAGPRSILSDNLDYYQLLPGGNVRLPFAGDLSYITDDIRLERDEVTLSIQKSWSDDQRIQARGSFASQALDTIYMHGYDYSSSDQLGFADLRYLWSSGAHAFTLGTETRRQRMSSQSVKLFESGALPSDSLDFFSQGIFGQSILALSSDTDLSLALRLDRLGVRWRDRPDGQNQLSSTLLSPRAYLNHYWSGNWRGELGYGRGYRVPLAFLESQHGLSESGFIVGITELEKSHSAHARMAHTQSKWETSAGAYVTWIENMAYAEQDVVIGDPVVFRNSDETYAISALELTSRWSALNDLDLSAGFEQFIFPAGYAWRLPTAPIEQRLQLLVDCHRGPFEIHLTGRLYGARDLARYRYGNRFESLQHTNPTDPPEFADIRGDRRKNSRAPAFTTTDLSFRYRHSSQISLKLTALNLFDVTQTGMGVSPLNWNQHGTDPTHFHLDNNFIWGPLRGRIVSLTMRVDL